MQGEYSESDRRTHNPQMCREAHDPDCLTRRIDQCVQQGNDWLERVSRSDLQNYINGDLDFALEFNCRAIVRNGGSELVSGKIVSQGPIETPIGQREVVHRVWKIGDKLSDHCGQTSCVIPYGYEEPVFIENIQFVDEVKEFVPSRFSIGLKPPQGVAKFCPNILGHSLLDFTVKPTCFFAERELDFPFFAIQAHSGRPTPFVADRDPLPVVNNIEEGVIERASEVVDDVAYDKGQCRRNGFVLFGPCGSFAGVCIGFNDVAERSRFTEEFVKFTDVLRGPINLKNCSVCHDKNRSDK